MAATPALDPAASQPAPIDPSSWGAKAVGFRAPSSSTEGAHAELSPDVAIDPASWGAKAIGTAASASAGHDSTSTIPELSAAPGPSLIDRISSEARDALSPVLGESARQKLDRASNMAALRSISPSLAKHVDDAMPQAQKDSQAHGAAGPIIDVGLRGGGAAAGQAIGAFGGPFDGVTIPLGGAIGGAVGDWLSQKRRIASGEQDAVKSGELAASAITGAIPGGNLAKTGARSVVSEAVKQGAGGLVGETTRSILDDHDMPSARDAAWAAILPALGGAVAEHVQQSSPEITAARTAAKGKLASKISTLDAAQKSGFVVEPSSVNPSILNKTVESMAGGPSIRQAATHVNQEVADGIARRILDPSNPDIDLTSSMAQAVRKRAYDVGYVPVSKAGAIPVDTRYVQDLNDIYNKLQGAARSFPGAVNNDVENLIKSVAVQKFDAGDAIKMTQILRNRAADSFTQGKNELGIAQRQAATAIEGQIERHLSAMAAGTVTVPPAGSILPPSAGTTASRAQAAKILTEFRDARTLMAQSHDIEDAIREGGGSIISSRMAAKAQAGKPLSGGLDTLGNFANNFPSVTRESSKTAVPGTTVTGNFARLMGGAGLAGAAGATTHSPEAAALAGAAGVMLPSIRGLVRSLVLSGPYQRIMAKYPINVEARPDLGALMIRQGAQAAAQENAESDAIR